MKVYYLADRDGFAAIILRGEPAGVICREIFDRIASQNAGAGLRVTIERPPIRPGTKLVRLR